MQRCEKQGVMEGKEGCREGGRDGKMDGRKKKGEGGERWDSGVAFTGGDETLELQMEAAALFFTCVFCVCVCGGIILNDLWERS